MNAHHKSWAGELARWLSSLSLKRLEETPPTRRIAAPARAQGESLGNGAETKRPPKQVPMRHAKLSRMLGGNDETAVLQVERANSR